MDRHRRHQQIALEWHLEQHHRGAVCTAPGPMSCGPLPLPDGRLVAQHAEGYFGLGPGTPVGLTPTSQELVRLTDGRRCGLLRRGTDWVICRDEAGRILGGHPDEFMPVET
ncbi:hypothetical protein TPB0596_09870 [Tsukamurella pulmonis]|nr:hypothetical protein TPB0596_09870 [Tsukamurella pulmonis]